MFHPTATMVLLPETSLVSTPLSITTFRPESHPKYKIFFFAPAIDPLLLFHSQSVLARLVTVKSTTGAFCGISGRFFTIS